MALSAFDDKAKTPEDHELEEVLDDASALWGALKASLARQHDPMDEEWVFSGKKWGWSLRLKRKKRAILYLTPCHGFFLAGFALGEKAVKAAHDSGLPAAVLATIDSAPKFAEGRGVRLEIRCADDVRNIELVAAVKMAT